MKLILILALALSLAWIGNFSVLECVIGLVVYTALVELAETYCILGYRLVWEDG